MKLTTRKCKKDIDLYEQDQSDFNIKNILAKQRNDKNGKPF